MASETDFSTDFKKQTTDDLLIIKHRLLWILMPTFFAILAVLGLSILTWIQVNDNQQQTKSLQNSIDMLNKHKMPITPGTEDKKTPGDKTTPG